MKYLILYFCLISFLVFANDIEKSYYCEKDQQFSYKNITCCETRIRKNKCIELVDKFLPEKIIDNAGAVIKGIKDNKWPWRHYPNCFWQALAFHDETTFSNPLEFADYELERVLAHNYIEINSENINLNYGDLVLFDNNYETWETGMYNKREYAWAMELFHATVYLEDGYIFQKESVFNTNFSIDKIDHVEKIILNMIKITTPHSRKHFVTKRYYKNKSFVKGL